MVQLQVRTVENVQAAAIDAARRATAALLFFGVSVIHVIDQGGIPGSKDPAYVGAGYYVLEIVGVIAALCSSSPVPSSGGCWRSAWPQVPSSGTSSRAAPACPTTATTRATGTSRSAWSASSSKASCSCSRVPIPSARRRSAVCA